MDNSRVGRALCSLLGTSFLFATPARVAQPRIEAGPIFGEICTPPIQPVDISQPSAVVGDGTEASCTEEALDEAIRQGGVITFDCGGNATIPITSQKELRTDVDTTIDGEGQITLDGSGATRLFFFEGPDFRQTTTTVTLQNLRLINGRASGTPIPEYPGEPPQCSRGFSADGGGGAIFIHDGILHVFNTSFENNQAEPLGPDVGGGAIYGLGSLEVIVIGSQFINNSGSNGGAVGALNTDLSVYNSSFDQSAALGHDANGWDPDCPDTGEESGSGGNGGAICIDGGFDGMEVFCGNNFTGSRAGENAFGGAIFRTANFDQQTTIIDQCSFEGSYSPLGGGAICKSANRRSLETALSSGALCRPTGQSFKWRTLRSQTATAISLGRWQPYSTFKPTSETVRSLETALRFRRSCQISPELRSRIRSSWKMPLWVATSLATLSIKDRATSNGRSRPGTCPIRLADAFSASAWEIPL